ncbi:hypothetical protein Syun_022637 [Stephania yunnanensis]|uniref:CASP-like protein n=1 Tax=Stephania yunnanensis TaxID=152371 RepID=A0AAP0F7D6_9MAGN
MAPPTSSPSLALPIINLVFRILTFIFLIASAIIVGINSMKAIVDNEIIITANIKIVNAHKYGVATCVLGMAYALFQIPFSIYHVSARKPMAVSDGLPLFTMFGDQVISYLLATGAAAIYGVSVDPKKFIDGLDDLLEQYGSGDISTLRSKRQRVGTSGWTRACAWPSACGRMDERAGARAWTGARRDFPRHGALARLGTSWRKARADLSTREARADLGTCLGARHETRADLGTRLGTPWHGALARLGTTPWHESGQTLARLGTSAGTGKTWRSKSKYAWLNFGCFLMESRKQLNIYYKERCALSLGGMGRLAGTLEHALGAMPRHDPWTDHGVGHSSSRWDSSEPRLARCAAWARTGTSRQVPVP